MDKKKIGLSILGIIAILVIGIYTVKPSIINDLIQKNKSELRDIHDPAFGVELKVPDRLQGKDIDTTYTSGEISHDDNSVGVSIIANTIKGSKDDVINIADMVKVNKDDWENIKKNVDIGELQVSIFFKKTKNYKLKDLGYKVVEGEKDVYLLLCTKNENTDKDRYVSIDELEKGFSVIDSNSVENKQQ